MTLHDQLEGVFRDVFDDVWLVIRDETTAADIPEWDSLAHLNLMLAIEETFNVRFSDRELAGFANVGELERWLAAHVPQGTRG